MTTLLNLFYHLPLEFIACCFALLSLVYLLVRERCVRRRCFRCGVWFFLMGWFAVVLWNTIFSRTPGAAHLPELLPFHSYREMLQTGNREILRSSFMNVALFYPAGLLTASLLPEQWPWRRKLMVPAIVFALFSLAIECTQSFCALGRPEIDDVLHNTLGAVCGAAPIILRDACSHSSEGAPTVPAR